MGRNIELDSHPCVEVIAQDLIDLMFQSVLTIHGNPNGYFKDKPREEVAKWVADVLRNAGYPTERQGISWGVLTK